MNMRLTALVVDDDAQMRALLKLLLEDEGWEVDEADSAESALEMIHHKQWRVVFCDVVMSGADGFSVLQRFRQELEEVKVVLMTGFGDAAGALEATSFGAYEYLLKPISVAEVRTLLKRLSKRRTDHPRSVELSSKGRSRSIKSDLNLVGNSESMISVMKLVGRVAPTNLPILLSGESGTGKEVVARAIHRLGNRAGGPFVAVNCGAIPADLIEAELFGHVKGAFTGADHARIGLLEKANNGTILLDEITETSQTFQVKLLRALQERQVRRVGSNDIETIDIRVIAASNRDIEEEVAKGRFRKDLFYRLNAVSIVLPPLRERAGDILPLVTSLASGLSSGRVISLSLDALELLESYPWPGNIRELENAITQAVAVCDATILPQDLPQKIRDYLPIEGEIGQNSLTPEPSQETWPSIFELEGSYVQRVMDFTNGNKQAAARLLKIDRKTLDRMIKRHKIDWRRHEKPFPHVA